MPPVHPYLSDDGVRDYFGVLMRELPLPFLAYKKGPFPSDALLGELADSGRLVGVKYAVNDLDAFARFAAAFGDRLGLHCGTAERLAPFFHLAGARGYTSGADALRACMERGYTAIPADGAARPFRGRHWSRPGNWRRPRSSVVRAIVPRSVPR
jgi:hypothetical protein